MTEEEKQAAEAKVLADKVLAEAEAARIKSEKDAKEAAENADKLAERDAEITRLTEERDNYKAVALKRKGKLSEDDEFFNKEGLDEFIKDKVVEALSDKEVARAQAEREAEIKRITKENAELRLAIKNKPGSSIGGGGGSEIETKDNVFSPEQLKSLEARAILLKADPQKFIENAKRNLLNRR